MCNNNHANIFIQFKFSFLIEINVNKLNNKPLHHDLCYSSKQYRQISNSKIMPFFTILIVKLLDFHTLSYTLKNIHAFVFVLVHKKLTANYFIICFRHFPIFLVRWKAYYLQIIFINKRLKF